MFLLIMRIESTGNFEPDNEIEVWKREFEVPNFSDMKGTSDVITRLKQQKMEEVADKVRQYLGLTAGHVKGITDWLLKAKIGDTLLGSTKIGGTLDEIAIIMCNSQEPRISRMEVEEVKVTKTKVSLVTLPATTKKVTPKSRTDKVKQNKDVKKKR
jgi:hypothetical protein